MKTTTDKVTKATFEKVGDVHNLYRYTGNNVYYALVRLKGKLHKRSLETEDKATAKRKLTDFQRDLGKIDTSQGKLTLRELCNRYLATIADASRKTQCIKKAAVARLLVDFKPGADVQVPKVKPSDLQGWIASYSFGYAMYNHYAQMLRDVFVIAVADKMIVSSPAADIKSKKVVKPIRVTPTFEEFNAIIADVRQQKWNVEAQTSADFLEFMGLVGVGQAEITGLLRQHVNLAKHQITFFRQKTRTPYTVPIYPQAEALVKKLVATPALKPSDALFPVNLAKSKNVAAEGKTKDAKKSLAAACKRLGYPAYTQRSLRRMFITRCIELGIDVKVIAQWQGHQDGGKLILGTYSHVRNVHAEEMARKLV